MRHKVLGFGWPFAVGQSSNSTRRPRLFDWTDDPSQATVDVAVYMSGAIETGINDPRRKIAWVMESPEIARWQYTTPFIEENLEAVAASYEYVLTSDREFCKLHPRFVYHPAGANLPWVREDQYAIYKKDKMCSMFASNKAMVPAHQQRRQVAERWRHQLDLFGGACGSPRIGGNTTHPDKSEGLLRYMFQVVMENAQVDLYYTEKITDCFATGTVPIYWGSDCIGELFDTKGIIPLTNDFDLGSLSEDLYYEMMPAIRHNFDLVQQLEGTDDLLFRRFILPQVDQIITPWIPTSWAEKQVLAEQPAPPPPRATGRTVPWRPWDPAEVSHTAQQPPIAASQRLRVVTDEKKQTITTMDAVPAERVIRRKVTSALQPPRSLAGTLPADWPPQLNDAFLLNLDDAFIGDGVVFDRERHYTMGRWWLGRSSADYAETKEVRHVERAVSIAAWGGEAFQHFVIDALPSLAAVIDLLETPELSDWKIVSHNQPNTPALWFWHRLGLADRVVAKPVNTSSRFVIHADRVLYPQFEPNINQLGLYPRNTLGPLQQRLGIETNGERDLAVYLQRSQLRAVDGEESLLSAVREVTRQAGLELRVFRGAAHPMDGEQLMRRARIVFGPHGGAFANLIFAQPGTHVVEFVPLGSLISAQARDPLSMYYGLAQAAGHDYWFVEPDDFGLEQQELRVDTEQVVETIRRALDSEKNET